MGIIPVGVIMLNAMIAFGRRLTGRKVVQIFVGGSPAAIDPRSIHREKWSKRVHAKSFIGHEEQSIETTIVGDSIILKGPVDGSFVAMTTKEFEATAYLFLMQKGYHMKAPMPHRQSDRF